MKKKKTNQNGAVAKYRLFFFISILILLFCTRKDDLQKGIDAIARGEYETAVKNFTSLLSEDSLNPRLHYNLSLAYAYLDSVNLSFHHYMKVLELESILKDDIQLRELLAHLLQIEPYATSPVKMKMMHQFKGAFSPDGKTIAVAAAQRDRADIYLISLSGSVIRKITQQGMNTDPDFSPTGEHIAFVSNRDGDEELYLYDLQNKQIDKLTDNTAEDFAPSFSPDGKEIVFISNRDDPYKWEIYKIDIANKKVKRLTRNNYWDGFPKFSSDGKSVVFSSKRNGGEDIYSIKKNGGGEKILYASAADDNDPLLIDENLFFKSKRDGEWEIYRYNVKDKSLLRITNNSWPDWNPRISKDGSKMLVARKRRKQWQLYFMNFTSLVSADLIGAKIKAKLGLKE